MKVSQLAVFPTVLALSACSSGGGSDSGGADVSSEFATKGVQAANLIADYGDAPLTPVGNMPTGTFVYEGVAGFNFGDVSNEYIASNAEALADVTLQADFDNASISGNLTNFVDYTNTKAAGQVDLRNGTIAGNEFTADATGSATYNGNPLVVQGTVDGDFVGPSGNAAIGRIEGTWGGSTVSGLIGAERK